MRGRRQLQQLVSMTMSEREGRESKGSNTTEACHPSSIAGAPPPHHQSTLIAFPSPFPSPSYELIYCCKVIFYPVPTRPVLRLSASPKPCPIGVGWPCVARSAPADLIASPASQPGQLVYKQGETSSHNCLALPLEVRLGDCGAAIGALLGR